MKKAMTERLGDDAEEVTNVLSAEKIPRGLIKDAMEIARHSRRLHHLRVGRCTDKAESEGQLHAGDRTELDSRIGQLLALAA